MFVLGSLPYFLFYFFQEATPLLSRLWSSLLLKNMPYFVQFPTRSETHEYVLNDLSGWINYIFSFDNYLNHLLGGPFW